MTGTVLCGVTDTPDGHSAAQMASALSERLGLRLVLAHVVDGIHLDGDESLTGMQGRRGGERALLAVARGLELERGAETRLAHGDRAERMAQLAAEEGADLVVLGSQPQGFRGRKLRCGLARELEATTPVPVLIAPPLTRQRSGGRLAEEPEVLLEATGRR